MRIRRLLSAAIAAVPRPGPERRCALCGHRVGRFLPYPDPAGALPPLHAELDMVGSVLAHFECPRCGSTDRERHLWLYAQRVPELQAAMAGDVVHFAPERRLAVRLRAAARRYVACDLFPNAPDQIRVDLLSMPFEAASVDLLVANHVLEHVDDDRRAVEEIARVLRPGALAVLQTPYSRKLWHTWSDPGLQDARARWQAYGQADHVRLYGRDFFERVQAGGLRPCTQSHDTLFTPDEAGRFGVNPAEPLMLFRRG